MDQYNQSYSEYTPPAYDQAPQPKNNNRTIIIVVVVILVLCCCLAAAIPLIYYVLGDIFTDALGITQLLTPVLLGV